MKLRFEFLIIFFIIILAGIWLITKQYGTPPPQPSPVISQTKIKADLIIKIPGNPDQRFTDREIAQNLSALAFTKQVVQVKTTGEGDKAFVTEINARVADPGKKEFWELYLNGQPSQLGAGSLILHDKDAIEWRISNY